jgi:hypothetical protein
MRLHVKKNRFFFVITTILLFWILPHNANSKEVSDSLYSEDDSMMQEDEAPVIHTKFDQQQWKKITKEINFNEEETKPPDTVFKKWNLSMRSFSGIAAKVIFFMLVITVLILVLLKLFSGNTVNNNKIKPATVFNIDELEENLQDTDLYLLLEKALTGRSFRLAIRIYYLIIIKELSLKQLIVWKKNKTNNEYIRELNNTPFYDEFRLITIAFERIWYGDSEIQEKDYDKLIPMFKKMVDKIKPQATV